MTFSATISAYTPTPATIGIVKGVSSALCGCASVVFGWRAYLMSAEVVEAGLNGVGAVASAAVAVWISKELFCPTTQKLTPPGFSPPIRRGSADSTGNPNSPRKVAFGALSTKV